MRASLSSKKYNFDSHRECAFARTWFNYEIYWTSRCRFDFFLHGLREHSLILYFFRYTLNWSLMLFVDRNTSITIWNKSRANKSSNRSPAHNEFISDSVQLWDTHIYFLLIQLIETHVRLSKKNKTTRKLILKPQAHRQSLSLDTNSIVNVVLRFPHDNIDDSLSYDECTKWIMSIVCH